MACIGGEKPTKENIHRTKVFSANLVTEELLPLADYLGNTSGTDPDKMKIELAIEEGRVLRVPVLTASPVNFELEAVEFQPKDDGEVILCRIRNTLQDDLLANGAGTSTDKLGAIAPVQTTCERYFGWKGNDLGAWGEPMKRFVK